MIHLDTSALVTALTGERRAAPVLRGLISDGWRLGISSHVLYEWLRGPRRPDELAVQQMLIAAQEVHLFGSDEALLAADLYRRLGRARGREMDIAIAACAISAGASLWTLNPRDFADIPGLTLVDTA